MARVGVLGVLLVWGVVWIMGCPPKKPETLPVVQGDGSKLLARLQKGRSAIVRLEGRAKLRVPTRHRRRRTYRVLFQIERPNKFRLQILAAMLQPALIVTTDGKNFALFNLLRKEFLRGPAPRLPQLLNRYLPGRLTLGQLVPLLFGEIPVLPASKTSMTAAKKAGVRAIALEGKGHKQTIWVELQGPRFLKTKIQRQGYPPVSLEYGRLVGNPPLPKRILFRLPQRKMTVTWIYSTWKVNPTFPANAFRQKTPSGVKVRILRP